MELISFRFEMGEAPYIYKDALIMTQDAYDRLTDDQILAMQQERYDRWYDLIVNAPTEEIIVSETTEEIVNG
jgi:hypothetical protein